MVFRQKKYSIGQNFSRKQVFRNPALGRRPKFSLHSVLSNFGSPLPPKPDSSGKPEGKERTKALKRIAGTNLYRSTEPALLKNKHSYI